jgi:hypothetical protein
VLFPDSWSPAVEDDDDDEDVDEAVALVSWASVDVTTVVVVCPPLVVGVMVWTDVKGFCEEVDVVGVEVDGVVLIDELVED